MSALTSARSTWFRRIKFVQLPLATGHKCFEGGMACLDTSAANTVTPGAVSATLIPIGKFVTTFDNTSGSAAVPVNVELNVEVTCRNWDSVSGGGAVTISNVGTDVYIASDHEVTTVSTGASVAGRVWDVNADGVWIQSAFTS